MRQHIFLGFASILVLFLGIGICAYWLFSGISSALDVIVGDSQRWILAGRAMKESAERINSTLSSALTGEEKEGSKWFESHAPAFERFLGRAGAAATLPGKGALADKIKEAEERYLDLVKKFWNTSDVGTRRTMYFSELLPLFTEIDNELQAIIGVNEVNATRLVRQARSVSDHAARTMFVVWVVGVGLVLSGYFATQRAIFRPIQSLTAVAVLDHGPGIPREFQSRIFERFFRIPGTEDSTGVGLGLAIAKEMVVSHGGSIGLQSTSGKGSEFYFDLPAINKGAKA